ncbi:MAG: MBL fold metallo-hydrolase, partial [Gammaproteobacteria bacterium]|nr:MBL fold metallo-hydrolase [Gammaproteobacteria bacterium]
MDAQTRACDGGCRHRPLRACLLGLMLVALGVAQAHPLPRCAAGECSGFDWQPLGMGLYAAIRREPAGLLEHANSLVIVSDRDVIVVDAQMTPRASRQLIRAIRSVTRLPVRYVINTHWHDDHVFGSAAYARAYPGVSFISSAETRADLASRGADNRRQFVAALPDEMSLLRHHLEQGTALDWRDLSKAGPPLDAATRQSYYSDLAQARSYLAEQARTPVVLPDTLVQSRLVLVRGAREIQVLRIGHAHTRGDVAVWLPRERVLATGDALSAIVPMAAPDADLREWRAILARLAALDARLIIPGHGPLQRDGSLFARTQNLFDAVLS